jgi:hypothetical protein
MIKELGKHYAKPTPKRWRQLGDALLTVGTTITGFAIYEDSKLVAISALIITVVGKFLTNFFKDEN